VNQKVRNKLASSEEECRSAYFSQSEFARLLIDGRDLVLVIEEEVGLSALLRGFS
jgi:hypothetical protein